MSPSRTLNVQSHVSHAQEGFRICMAGITFLGSLEIPWVTGAPKKNFTPYSHVLNRTTEAEKSHASDNIQSSRYGQAFQNHSFTRSAYHLYHKLPRVPTSRCKNRGFSCARIKCKVSVKP